MARKIFLTILLFYFLVLFQSSFLSHFYLFLFIPPLSLIVVILINLFEARKENFGLFSAFFGGFFLDIFSERFFGFWILILLFLAAFIKFFLKKYIQLVIDYKKIIFNG